MEVQLIPAFTSMNSFEQNVLTKVLNKFFLISHLLAYSSNLQYIVLDNYIH